MTNWAFWIPMFLLLGAPTAMLILDRIKGLSAPRFLRTQGLPALVLFAVLFAYLAAVGDPLVQLVVWGLVGGLVATVALDAVRLAGVRLGAFPMDMPRMFGLMVLGLAPRFQQNVLANMVLRVTELPEEERRRFMEERIHFMGVAPEALRRTMLSGMAEGLSRLPEAERQAVRRTQMDILASAPEPIRRKIMATMDSLTAGVPGPNPSTGAPIRGLKMPQVPMKVFRSLQDKALPETLQQTDTSFARVAAAGYAWHFVNGATYGMAYTFLFGHGSWPLAILWGVFVWAVMMASMPKMMPMIKLPYPRFTLVPFLAHIAMAIPIGLFALAFVSPGAHVAGFSAGTGLDELLRFLGLL